MSLYGERTSRYNRFSRSEAISTLKNGDQQPFQAWYGRSTASNTWKMQISNRSKLVVVDQQAFTHGKRRSATISG